MLRVLAISLIALGALALLDAGVTLVWQEPISALYAVFKQNHLRGELQRVERTPATPVEQRALASIADVSRRIEYLARELQEHTANGSPVGRIVIPRIDAKYVIVKGTGTDELESGPGIYSETNFPGIPGTTAIAGHRTTYLAPFRDINELSPGNHIELQMPYANLTYTVLGQRVVSPYDVQAAISRVSYSRVVLSACTPRFSAAKRLLVFAKLTRIAPKGAALRLGHDRVPHTFNVAPSTGARAPGSTRRLHVVLKSADLDASSPLV
jgi:sortase A